MELSINNFVEAMRDTVLSGEGFIPFIGSGCSALSGILMGMDFDNYLKHVVLKCIHETDPWDLRQDGWPAQPNASEIKQNNDDLRILRSPITGESKSRRNLREAALSSFSHWTQILHFLSRIALDTSSGKSVPVLGASYQPVALVDQFHSHITGDRKPNLIHLMLCHLSGAARIRTHLTTNFDNLLETAFREMGEDLNVYSVSLFGGLPHPSLVHGRNTIIKLHGSLFETRANITLDMAPDERDLDRIYHYVRGCHPYKNSLVERPQNAPPFVPSNLLVCGYSGWDERCNLMIRATVKDDTTNPGKVFWVCFNQADMDRVKQIFTEPELNSRIFVTKTERLDLLLYEFYQRLVLCLPRGGLSYQSTHSVPPENGFFADPEVDATDNVLQALKNQWEKNKIPGQNNVLMVPTHDHGLQKPLRKFFNDLSEDNTGKKIISVRKIWLELEDFQNAASVAHTFLQIVAVRTGRFQVDHSILVPKRLFDGGSAENWTPHLNLLVRYLAIEPSQWVLVLYGRYGPGGCAGWKEMEIWPDDEHLQAFVEALYQCGFNVIYCPYDEKVRQAYDRARVTQIKRTIEQVAIDLQLRQIPVYNDLLVKAFGPSGKHLSRKAEALGNIYPEPTGVWNRLLNALSAISEMASAEGKTPQDEWKSDSLWRVIYGITLFRQSRRYSAFLSEGVMSCPEHFNCNGVDNDVERMLRLKKILGLLDANGLIFRKPGGFAWMYKDARVALRVALEHLDDANLGLGLKAGRAEQHFWIADWFMKSFYASGHADPLVEALYHYRMCSLKSSETTDKRGAYFCCAGISQMARALDIGHSALQFWQGGPRLSALFPAGDFETVGHPIYEILKQKDLVQHEDAPQFTEDLFEALKAYWSSIQLSHEDRAGRERYRSIEQFTIRGKQRLHRDTRHAEYLQSLRESPVEDATGLPRELLELVFEHRLTGEPLFHAMRQKMFRSIFAKGQNFGTISDTLQSLGEWSYVLLRKAKRFEVIEEALDTTLRIWLAVCVLARATLAHCFICHPALTPIEWKQRVMVLSDYGLALAKLGRFREAHRRLNEAHGILSKMENVATSVLAGIVELRKAESILLESAFLRLHSHKNDGKMKYYELSETQESADQRKERLKQLSVARCDDAWIRLGIARQHLTGRTHSAHWWLVVYMMEIECIAEGEKQKSANDRYCPLVCHLAQKPEERLERLLINALAMAAEDDHYNRLRVLETYCMAAQNSSRSSFATDEVKRIGTEIWQSDEFTQKYYKKVARGFGL